MLLKINATWNEIMDWIDINTNDSESGETSKFLEYLEDNLLLDDFRNSLLFTDKFSVIEIINEFITDTK